MIKALFESGWQPEIECASSVHDFNVAHPESGNHKNFAYLCLTCATSKIQLFAMSDQLDSTLTLRLPEDLKLRLKAEADKHWLKPSDLARLAIRDFLGSECGTTESQNEKEAA